MRVTVVLLFSHLRIFYSGDSASLARRTPELRGVSTDLSVATALPSISRSVTLVVYRLFRVPASNFPEGRTTGTPPAETVAIRTCNGRPEGLDRLIKSHCIEPFDSRYVLLVVSTPYLREILPYRGSGVSPRTHRVSEPNVRTCVPLVLSRIMLLLKRHSR